MGQRDDHIDLRTRYERALGDPDFRVTDLLQLSAELGEELAERDPDAAVIVLRAAADAAAVRPAGGDAEATVRVLRDLNDALVQVIETRDRQLQQARIDLRELNDRSELDALTRLVNRDGLTSALTRLGIRSEGCAVLAIDLDRFGRLNETLGHQAGDELLVEQSRRLQRIA